MSVQDRIDFVEFFEHIRRNNWGVSFHNISPRFQKFLPTGNNTSESFISFWKARVGIGKSDIAVKMFFDLYEKDGKFRRDKSFQSLIYESRVYHYITEKIIATKEAPNFIAYVAMVRALPDVIEHATNDSGRVNSFASAMATIHNVHRSYFEDMRLVGIVTQAPPNTVTLDQWYKSLCQTFPKYEDREEIFLPVLFQLLYCLCVLDKHKIMHNDLHLFNVLISTLDSPVRLKYEVNGKKYAIITKHIVYIFDWGNAWIESIGDNPILSGFNCKALNMCNRFFRGYDMFVVLCNLNFDGVGILRTKHALLKEHDYNRSKIIKVTAPKGNYSFNGEPLMLNPDKYDEFEEFVQTHSYTSSNYGKTVAMTKQDLMEFLLPAFYEKVDDIESGVFTPILERGIIIPFGLFPCRMNFVPTVPLTSPWDFFNNFPTFDRYTTSLFPTWRISETDMTERRQEIMFATDFENVDMIASDSEESASDEEDDRDSSGTIRTPSPSNYLRTSTLNDPD